MAISAMVGVLASKLAQNTARYSSAPGPLLGKVIGETLGVENIDGF
jgi:hypothetical protein